MYEFDILFVSWELNDKNENIKTEWSEFLKTLTKMLWNILIINMEE